MKNLVINSEYSFIKKNSTFELQNVLPKGWLGFTQNKSFLFDVSDVDTKEYLKTCSHNIISFNHFIFGSFLKSQNEEEINVLDKKDLFEVGIFPYIPSMAILI